MSDFLDQFITDNDKEPSWDGFVYIYGERSKEKSKLKGRMPVQVKGIKIMIIQMKLFHIQCRQWI